MKGQVPWDWDGLSNKEYYINRKKAIDNSKYEGTSLVVITEINKGEIKNGN